MNIRDNRGYVKYGQKGEIRVYLLDDFVVEIKILHDCGSSIIRLESAAAKELFGDVYHQLTAL